MPRLKTRILMGISQTLCYALHCSYRYKVLNPQYRQQAEGLHPKASFVIASWHQNCFAGILSHAGQNLALLVSRSFDGNLISAVAHRLGLETIRGSSRKGGQDALTELIQRVSVGQRAAFTVDGPKGPIYEVKRGIFQLSASTSAPILPLLAIADRYWTIKKSWDRFRIPKPFARVSVIYGKPFIVSQLECDTQLEALSQRLKQELHVLERGFPQPQAGVMKNSSRNLEKQSITPPNPEGYG